MEKEQQEWQVTIEAISARSDAHFEAMIERIKTDTDKRIIWTVGSMVLFSLGLVALLKVF